jgi:nucleotide-binding universal stress UspA family protein
MDAKSSPVVECVVVGTDGSVTAARAVERALIVAAALRATAHVVDVVVPPQVGVPLGAPGAEALRGFHSANDARAGMTLADASEIGRSLSLDVITHLEHGDPASCILTVAERVEADLIVVGSRGVDHAGRYVLGSVPEQVLMGARCDVLVVRTT